MLQFVIAIMGQWPLISKNPDPLKKVLVWVEQGLFLYKDFAAFWTSHDFKVQSENHRWIPVDIEGQVVNISSGYKSITWRHSLNRLVENKASYG